MYDMEGPGGETVISIVVPAYNAAQFLPVTLNTVFAQTYREWELILVDDGSQDDTAAVANSYAIKDARVRVFTKENGGCASARNYGAAQASLASEYIIFMDHDDLWEPYALETLLSAAQSLPQSVGAFAGAHVLQAAEPQQAAESVARKSLHAQSTSASRATVTFADMTRLNPIWTMGQVLIRRSSLQTVGLLDTKSAPADDWDLYLRLTLLGDLVVDDTPIIYWRKHDTNISKNRRLMRQSAKYVRGKLLASSDLSPAQREIAAGHFRNARRNLSLAQLQWAKDSFAHRQIGQALHQIRRAVYNYALSRIGFRV